jgi:hypothetical protein
MVAWLWEIRGDTIGVLFSAGEIRALTLLRVLLVARPGDS